MILGTAHFGQNYGLFSKNTWLSEEDAVSTFLNEAFDLGVRAIDTAQTYGQSEILIGKSDSQRFRITTKVHSGDILIARKKGFNFPGLLEKSFVALKVPVLDTLLLHDWWALPVNVLTEFCEYLAGQLSDTIHNFGISIYAPEDFGSFPRKDLINVVQAPMSLVDRRFVSSSHYDICLDHGVQIQARSVFLQGVLLNAANVPSSFRKKYAPELMSITQFFDALHSPPIEICLQYIGSLQGVTPVIGVDSIDQLRDVVKYVRGRELVQSELDLTMLDFSDAFLDPRLWPTQSV